MATSLRTRQRVLGSRRGVRLAEGGREFGPSQARLVVRERRPDGKVLAGPLVEEEGIVTAAIDPAQAYWPASSSTRPDTTGGRTCFT